MNCKMDRNGNVVDFNLGEEYSNVTDTYTLYHAMKFVNLRSDSFAEFSSYDLFGDATAEGDGPNWGYNIY